MDLKDIQAIVFDMGGTLYDTPREIILMTRFILDALGLEEYANLTKKQIEDVSKQVDRMFDQRLVDSNVDPYWLPSFDDSIVYDRVILERLGVEGDLDKMASRAHKAWTNAFDSVKPKFLEPCREVLESLHERGYQLGIASNRRNDPIPHLEAANVLHLFDVVEYSCVPGYRKPSPFMLLQAASKLGINPQKCAYVGDKVEHDVGAARRAEFLPILIVWCDKEEAGWASEDLLVIDHIDELLELFPSMHLK
ncbi:MAG: HAD family hydrolase [Candidatus Thorarchaeota archaeon]